MGQRLLPGKGAGARRDGGTGAAAGRAERTFRCSDREKALYGLSTLCSSCASSASALTRPEFSAAMKSDVSWQTLHMSISEMSSTP